MPSLEFSKAIGIDLNLDIYCYMLCPQKLFSIEMAEFKVQIKCMWNSETCQFEKFVGEEQTMEDKEDDDDDDDAA